MPRLAVIVPCYNEHEVLSDTIQVLTALLARMQSRGLVSEDSFVLFVDDASRDNTWQIIDKAHQDNPTGIKGLSFVANAGQQNALLAGLFAVADIVDCAITIDADLQDDPDVIPKMVEKFIAGADVVYGVRSSRQSDSFLKRSTAHAFYRTQQMLGVPTVFDHSEFRLLSTRAISMLSRYDERNLFLRSTIISLGLPSDIVYHARNPRKAGETKYSMRKLLTLAADGITSFTIRPIRLIFFVGLIIMVLDVFVAIWALISHFYGEAVSGWTSLIMSVWFLGGLILMALGVVGEYIGKTYIEVKHRPRYTVGKTLM